MDKIEVDLECLECKYYGIICDGVDLDDSRIDKLALAKDGQLICLVN